MPEFQAFRDTESYYATLAHELTHWTRHPSRLDRDFGRKRWGDDGYAREELVAELGAVGVSLGDTTGMATPAHVWNVVPLLRERLPEVGINLHFHDTRGAAMANVVAAMEVGDLQQIVLPEEADRISFG